MASKMTPPCKASKGAKGAKGAKGKPKTPKTPRSGGKAGKAPSSSAAGKKGLTTPKSNRKVLAAPKSSAKKGKRRLTRSDLVPERPQGTHIMTFFHKDINLLHVKQNVELYSACRLWMASDPLNEPEVKRSARGALAGFPLPLPDTSIPAWMHPPPPKPSAEEWQARCSALDAVVGRGGGGGAAMEDDQSASVDDAKVMSSENSIKVEHMARWKQLQAETAAMHGEKNVYNLSRYAASVGIIRRDQKHPPAAANHAAGSAGGK